MSQQTLRSAPLRIRRTFLSMLMAVGFVAATGSTAFAVDCVTTLARVREENNGKVMVYFSNGSWHNIAADSHPARADRLSIVMAAFLAGRNVLLRYGSTYSCSATDYSEIPVVVEIQ